MRILYIDLTAGIGGSILSLEQLLGAIDRRAFEPIVLLSSHNPAIERFRAMQVPVVTISTVTADTARSSGVVSFVKGSQTGQRLRDGGLYGHLWTWTRSVRNVLARTLPLTWRLSRAIRTAQPALVHINDAVFVSRPAIAAAWLAGVPSVCHVRSLGPFRFWDRLWARTVQRFIFISQWVADDQRRQGIPAAKGRLIYNGIDLTVYATQPDRYTARAMLDLPSDRPIIAVAGRLVPWKGQDLFLEAMRLVVDSVPDALGLIVGEVESFSRGFGDELRALRDRLGLRNAVRFLGHSDDMPSVLAAIDGLAHTSVTPEPFGRVIVEAMAASRPVITPAEGGGTEIVVDGVTGRWFQPRDPNSLAQAIIDLLTHPETARAMGSAGRERAFQCFSSERLAAEVSALYRDLGAKRLRGK
jgi:glycosyltransferase involved in cell wall biosynthesis